MADVFNFAPMQVKIFDSYTAMSHQLATEITGLVRKKPAAVLCLAAGDTPRLAYELIAENAKTNQINFSQCTFIGLDEWVGIPPENAGSCHYFLKKYLFDPLKIAPAQVHLFDAMSGNLTEQCLIMNNTISSAGGIDCMVVGIGMNGHIGFNEPGVSFDQSAHVVNLDENTRSVGQKYFQEPTLLQKGITLGLQQLLAAREAILIANGIKKAAIVKQALEGKIDPTVPASIMQLHHNGSILLDQDAASLLRKTNSNHTGNDHAFNR